MTVSHYFTLQFALSSSFEEDKINPNREIPEKETRIMKRGENRRWFSKFLSEMLHFRENGNICALFLLQKSTHS